MAEELTVIACYEVYAGDGSGTYDAPLVYDEWPGAVADIKAALDHGRQLLIERVLMTRAEYDEFDPVSEDDRRRLRGEPIAAATSKDSELRT